MVLVADDTRNVKLSIEDRADSQLAATAAIHWQGAAFNQGAVDEWFQPRLLGFTGAAARNTARTELWTLSVNCFANTGAGKSKDRVWQLADLVITAFEDFALPVKDWLVNPPVTTLYYLLIGKANVTPVPGSAEAPDEQTEPQQLNVSFPCWLIT